MARDVFLTAARWLERGRRCAVATLVGTRGGAPVAIGSSIAVNAEMEIAGGLGAGCYESEIVRAALETCGDGKTRFLEIDLGTDDDPLSAASGCGSVLEIAVWNAEREDCDTFARIASGADAVPLTVRYERAGIPATFHHLFEPKARLVIVGATPLADEIAFFAQRLDLRSIVVDPRPAYATRERLPNVSEITVAWPQDVLPELLAGGTPAVVLSHDPKIDVPALACALQSRACYIGLLGSRKSQAHRRQQLLRDAFTAEDCARIHGPAGLDLGGESVSETALSIVAEIVACARGRSGGMLSSSETPIHAAKVAAGNAGT